MKLPFTYIEIPKDDKVCEKPLHHVGLLYQMVAEIMKKKKEPSKTQGEDGSGIVLLAVMSYL